MSRLTGQVFIRRAISCRAALLLQRESNSMLGENLTISDKIHPKPAQPAKPYTLYLKFVCCDVCNRLDEHGWWIDNLDHLKDRWTWRKVKLGQHLANADSSVKVGISPLANFVAAWLNFSPVAPKLNVGLASASPPIFIDLLRPENILIALGVESARPSTQLGCRHSGPQRCYCCFAMRGYVHTRLIR